MPTSRPTPPRMPGRSFKPPFRLCRTALPTMIHSVSSRPHPPELPQGFLRSSPRVRWKPNARQLRRDPLPPLRLARRNLRDYCRRRKINPEKEDPAAEFAVGSISRKFLQSLRQPVSQPRNCLHQVVVNYHHRKQHEEHERSLIDPLLDAHADIATHQTFD